MTTRRVVVVEDHPTVREGLCLVLEREGFSVVGRAGTVDEGHTAIVEAEPDVALIDVTTLHAVRSVAAGGTFIDPEVRARLMAQPSRERLLTVREREVLSRLAEGRSIEDIAAELVLSTETIRTHIRNAMGKLGTRTRAHAIVVALRRGELAL